MPLRDFQLRPWRVGIVAPVPECELCTWVYSSIMGDDQNRFVLKFVNRICRVHGEMLPVE